VHHPPGSSSLLVLAVHVLLSGLSVLIVGKLMPGIRIKSYGSAVAFAIVAGFLNAIAWHLLSPLTIPFSVLTLGVGALIINGVLFLIADAVVPGVEISGCVTAALASLGVSFLNAVMQFFLGKWAP
jgi:putative membrane protein